MRVDVGYWWISVFHYYVYSTTRLLDQILLILIREELHFHQGQKYEFKTVQVHTDLDTDLAKYIASVIIDINFLIFSGIE